MEKHFVADGGFPRVFERKTAKGYKKIILDETVNMPCSLSFESNVEDGILTVKGSACESNEPDAYTVLCKEFGLVGDNIKFSSDVSIIFLSDGWMLVTLYKGGFVLNLEDRLLFASLHITDAPYIEEDRILWVNADMLRGYAKYWGDKGSFVQDFEFAFEISGGAVKGCRSLKVRHIEESDIDMSLGTFAQWQQQTEAKERAKEAKKKLSFLGVGSASTGLEFESNGEDEYEDEDSDYDDYDED